MENELLSLRLKALADPHRRKILSLLQEEAKCACDILPYFEFTQPTLSHHMKILEQVGFVSVEKRKSWHYYAVHKDVMAELLHELTMLMNKNDTKEGVQK